MSKIEHALKLAKDCTYADEMTEGAKEFLRMKIDEALEELNQNKDDYSFTRVSIEERQRERSDKYDYLIGDDDIKLNQNKDD
jgi:glutathione synthase/RimK-type ligase-like ATP-grasp enzyme